LPGRLAYVNRPVLVHPDLVSGLDGLEEVVADGGVSLVPQPAS